jgi:hypothetical protein
MLNLLLILILFANFCESKEFNYIYKGDEPKIVSDLPQTNYNNGLEKYGIALCAFPEESLKTSPALVIYCIVIALLWLLLMITLCFGYIRMIIEKIHGLARNGFENDRINSPVDERGPEALPRLLPLGSVAQLNNIPLGTNC